MHIWIKSAVLRLEGPKTPVVARGEKQRGRGADFTINGLTSGIWKRGNQMSKIKITHRKTIINTIYTAPSGSSLVVVFHVSEMLLLNSCNNVISATFLDGVFVKLCSPTPAIISCGRQFYSICADCNSSPTILHSLCVLLPYLFVR